MKTIQNVTKKKLLKAHYKHKILFSQTHSQDYVVINLLPTRNPVKYIGLSLKKWMLSELTGFTQSHTIFTSETTRIQKT